jgi:acetyl esterase/lipase
LIPKRHIDAAATHLTSELGPGGLTAVGGETWWQWRSPDTALKGEWIEMRSQYNTRKARNEECTRVMLYIHGGAYYFGSVDEHRYQMQRHARKLQARVFAPRYRLAPQFPFPCGLYDCLAAYLYLLTIQPPETILVAGDSAGGGMVTALLCILRDQGIPLPAGGILLSPWVDLTHSFPSVAGGNEYDYIPSNGFVHRPSRSWPPPNSDDLRLLDELVAKGHSEQVSAILAKNNPDDDSTASLGFNTTAAPVSTEKVTLPGRDVNLSVIIDDTAIEIKDQIQIYAANNLLSHPLVSPVLQPSLGGLPPLLIQVGGGEMLRDEQIYLAHKAAAPAQYAPSAAHLALLGKTHADVTKYPPTDVQLQVWEDLCHVAPTLSFTRPAQYMYNAAAQFGVWALAKAQKKSVEEYAEEDAGWESEVGSMFSSDSEESSTTDETSVSDDEVTGAIGDKEKPGKGTSRRRKSSTIAGSTTAASASSTTISSQATRDSPTSYVGQPGDPLPLFTHHMIRQRITRHGGIYPLEPASTLPACSLTSSEIGVIKAGPVRKWLAAQSDFAKRYAKEKRHFQDDRVKEMSEIVAGSSVVVLPAGERPPPTALVGRRQKTARKVEKSRLRSVGTMALKMWSGWGSKHDEEVVEARERAKSGAGLGEAGDEAGRSRRGSVARARDRAASSSKAGVRKENRRMSRGDRGVAAKPAFAPAAEMECDATPPVSETRETTQQPLTTSSNFAVDMNAVLDGTRRNSEIDASRAPVPIVENGEVIPGYIASLQRPEAVRFVTAREE